MEGSWLRGDANEAYPRLMPRLDKVSVEQRPCITTLAPVKCCIGTAIKRDDEGEPNGIVNNGVGGASYLELGPGSSFSATWKTTPLHQSSLLPVYSTATAVYGKSERCMGEGGRLRSSGGGESRNKQREKVDRLTHLSFDYGLHRRQICSDIIATRPSPSQA